MVEETREVEDRRKGHVEERMGDEIAPELRSVAEESRDDGDSRGQERDVDGWGEKNRKDVRERAALEGKEDEKSTTHC